MAFPPNFSPRPPSSEPTSGRPPHMEPTGGAPEAPDNEPKVSLSPEECATLADALTPEVMAVLTKLAGNESEPDADDQGEGEGPAALVIAAPAPPPPAGPSSFPRAKTALNRV